LKKDNDGEFLYKNGKLDYKFISGDILNVLTCLLIKPDFVAVPIHLNHRAGLGIFKKNNIEVKITKIGEPPVIKAIMDKLKVNPELKTYGFERNGGGILVTDFFIPGFGQISSLAARDALFPIVCTLILAKNKKISLDNLMKEVFSKEYFSHTHSGLVENLPGVSVTKGLEKYNHEVGKNIVKKLKPIDENIIEIDFEEARLDFFNNDDKGVIDEKVVEHLIMIRNVLHSYISEIIIEDFKIKKINFLDGVKIYLDNEEIIHLRPSGNAAQFRIYIESPDEERAVKLVESSVIGNSGMLVKFINDFIEGKINL
jgi:phosphomannomutase